MSMADDEREATVLVMSHKLALALGAKQVQFVRNEPVPPGGPNMLVWANDLPMQHSTPGRWGNQQQWLYWDVDMDAFSSKCHRKD